MCWGGARPEVFPLAAIHQAVNSMQMDQALPPRIADLDALEELLSGPSPELTHTLARAPGDSMVLDVGGKMGPTLARMAKRADPGRRVIGVARFSEAGLRERLQAQGIECMAADLLSREALQRLPDAP